jgi:hypothetical protein
VTADSWQWKRRQKNPSDKVGVSDSVPRRISGTELLGISDRTRLRASLIVASRVNRGREKNLRAPLRGTRSTKVERR